MTPPRPQPTLVLVWVLLMLVTGCGESDSDGPQATADSNTTQEADCEDVSSELIAAIADGEQEGAGMEPVDAAAWRSPDYEQVWFVSMEFSGSGIVDSVRGVWATNSLDAGEGIIMSVDGFAHEFTNWPDAATTDAAITETDPGVAKAKACLG